jgi:hypothetical protein
MSDQIPSNVLEKACRNVYKQVPFIDGSKPKIQSRPNDQWLLVFEKTAQGAGDKSIHHTVRVVVDKSGKIIKLSTSR